MFHAKETRSKLVMASIIPMQIRLELPSTPKAKRRPCLLLPHRELFHLFLEPKKAAIIQLAHKSNYKKHFSAAEDFWCLVRAFARLDHHLVKVLNIKLRLL